MDQKIIKFDDTEIEEYNKLVAKLPLSKQDFKYFICYKDSEKIRPLCTFCPQIIYKINFDENRHIYFLRKKEKVFVKYMEILEKVSNIIKTKFNKELIYCKKYL